MDYEYFTNVNEEDIFIEKRDGRFNAYAVWEKGSCVCDLLNKKKALSIANELYKESKKGA